jgi:hypothetical protein
VAAALLLASCGGSSTPGSVSGQVTTPSGPTTASAVPTLSATSSPSPADTPSPTTPSPIATPTASRLSAAEAAIMEVASQVFPPTSPSSHPPGPGGFVECEFSTGVDFDFSGCPVTARFAARLHQNPSASDQARPFCRCQNILPIRDITVESTASGGVAHVDLGNARIDLLMTVEGGRLVVDDTQCPGKGAATSYYVDPVPPCA